ncbi:MAG: sugar ABC transporter permease [Anaerolineae bacterium]|nr:sugar ABC transporter permease [Anaerolineae bacterium]
MTLQKTGVVKSTQNKGFRGLSDNEGALGSLFLLPAIIYIVALVAVPFFIAIAFSFSDVTVGNTSLNYVGLENFARVIKTPQFKRALINSIGFTFVTQVIVIVLANILAVILSQDFRGKWIARMLIILPWATPISLGTIGWLWLLDSKFSPFDWFLVKWGLLGPDTILGPGTHMIFLGREWLAMASVVTIYVWRILPLSTVILLAGLTSINQDILDQAEVDGSKFFRTLFTIKLPLILPIMAVAVLFGIIFTFTDMTVVYILTRGGPIYYTQVLPVWAYFKGIDSGALADGAAIALFLFPVLLAVVILMLRTASRTEIN